jgi:hypothetical protein
MIINTEADKTVIACSLHGREYFSAFSDQMSVEDMRRELIGAGYMTAPWVIYFLLACVALWLLGIALCWIAYRCRHRGGA